MFEQMPSWFGNVLAFGAALIVLSAKDWFKARTSGNLMTKADCEKCRADCRRELEKELAAGDKSFQEIKQDISTMKTAMMGVVLALIPICETVTDGKADCSELQRIAQKLTE